MKSDNNKKFKMKIYDQIFNLSFGIKQYGKII